jgi:predicted Rossmann fold nucleotide-binding protein DprA/Smf involved in DNA uptake
MFGYARFERGAPGYPAALARLGRHAPSSVSLLGNPAALSAPLIGILCSRQVPKGMADLVYEWACSARDLRFAVVGGFLSPAERECLDVLLEGSQPVVVCLARGLAATRVPSRWRTPVQRGRLLLLSPFEDDVRHVTHATAEVRNRVVAALAYRLVVPHAAPNGRLLSLVRSVIRDGIPVHSFDHPENRPLLRVGARF